MSDMVSVSPCPNKHPHGAHEWSSPLNINGTRFITIRCEGVTVERPTPPEPEGDVIVGAVSKALDESRGRRYLFSRGPDGWYSRSTMGATPWDVLTRLYGEIKVYRAEES